MFTAYPLVIYEQDDKPIPKLKDVIDGLLSHSEIPIRVISDPEEEQFKIIRKQLPIDIKVLHVIVVIKYLKIFEA